MLLSLLIVSIVLQFVAAGLAFVMIRRTERTAVWLVMSSALLLMAIRRSISLIHTLTSDVIIIDPVAEGIALLISCLMVIGVWLIGGVFDRLGNLRAATQHELNKRIKAEKKLGRKNVLLQEMGRIAHVGGWEFDPATGQGTWTDEVTRIHDLDPKDETSLEKGVSFYRNRSRQKIDRAVKEAFAFGSSYDLELELVSAKGVHKWVRTIGSPVVEDGKVVRVHGTFQDITAHKKAEQEIRQITERQKQLADIIEKAEQPVSVGYPDGRLGLCNWAFCELTGYSIWRN
nr:PAS domain S-box protein [uncultured Desulfobacter sp.]